MLSFSDIGTSCNDPNPIINGGCTQSVGGIQSIAALCLSLDIEVKLRPLDCEPCIYGYGRECNEADIAFAVWNLHIEDMTGLKASIPFNVTPGDGFILLENDILHKSYLMGPENMLVVPPGVKGLSSKKLCFGIYSDPTESTESDSVRT